MRLNRILLAFLIAAPLSIGAQDIHFTQFTYVPLAINPAQTGLFEGTYRIGGLYRNQWSSGVKNGYQTPDVFIDIPIAGLRKTDWIGIGVNVFQDKAGIAGLTTSQIGLYGAYHIGLDKKLQNVLSIGVTMGFTSRKVDATLLRFQDAIISQGTSADVQNIEKSSKSYTDFSVGANFRSKMTKTATLNIGISGEHIASPKSNLVTATISQLPLRLNIYATVEAALTKRVMFYPAVIFRTAAGQSETMIHAVGGLKIDPKKNLLIRGGLGYRVGDAVQILGGLDFGDLRVGASYDLTASALRSDTKVKDGFEIAVGYIGKIFKKPNPPAAVLCPKY